MKVKKIRASVVFFMMLLLFVLTLSPVAVAQSEKKGSISLNLVHSETGTTFEGATFRLFMVAKALLSDNGVSYEFVSPYDTANADLSNLQDSYLPVHLAYFAFGNSLPCTEKTTDEKGRLVFDNLEYGLYLVMPVTGEEDDFLTSPFLVSVPGYDSLNKTWKYDVDASPKFIGGEGEEGKDTYISVVKKWDTDKSHPESVTVVLLRDFQEYEKVQLSDANSWHYRWDNLSKEYTWSVVEENVPEGYTVRYETSSNAVTIINKAGKTEESTTKPPADDEDKLVQTGQLNWPVPVCAIAGLLIFSIGWAVLNFGRKETEQE